MHLHLKPITIITFLALILLGLIPKSKVLIADWVVLVTDESNRPVSAVRISQNWDSYTFSLSGYLDLYTDTNGQVIFPKRERSAPISYWLAKALWTKVTYGAHASSGVIGSVRVSDPRFPSSTSAGCAYASCTNGKITSQLRISVR